MECTGPFVFCEICQGLPRRSNEVCGMKVGAGATRSGGRGRSDEGRESLRGWKREALPVLSLRICRPGRELQLIRDRRRQRQDSEFLLFLDARIKTLEPTFILNNLVSKRLLGAPSASSAGRKALREPGASAEAGVGTLRPVLQRLSRLGRGLGKGGQNKAHATSPCLRYIFSGRVGASDPQRASFPAPGPP